MAIEDNNPTAKDYLAIVGRRRRMIASVVLATLACAVLYSFVKVPVFEAEAQVAVTTRDWDSLFNTDGNLRDVDATNHLQTEIQVLEGEQVRRLVEANLGLNHEPPKVSAFVIGSTNVLEVRVQSTEAGESARLAN